MGDAVQGFLLAAPEGGQLVTGEMYCPLCEWVGNRTYNPRLPELEICPACRRDNGLRPQAKDVAARKAVAVGDGERV